MEKAANSNLSASAGFTLLEVLIAMSIMLVAFTSIFLVQSGSIKASQKAREINIVYMLAKDALVDAELAFEGKTFEEVKKEEKGSFPPPYESYSWARTIKEVELPSINVNPTAGGKDGSKSGSGGGGESSNSFSDMLTKLLTQYLSKALREVTVTVSWGEGKMEQKYSISTYWVNLNNDFQITQ